MGIVLLIVFALSQRAGRGQSDETSPSDLIREVARRPPVIAGTCGEFHYAAEREHSDLESLVRFGAEAIPAIDAALDSIDQKGQGSEFVDAAGLLLLADARLKGAAAFPRLRELRGDPHFTGYIALDTAAAISLGMTSYVRVVNYYREPFIVDMLRNFRRGGKDECGNPIVFTPKQALDFMILAWEKGDHALLQETLGPIARAGLDSVLIKDGTWDALRTRLWRITLTDQVAVGYRLGRPEGVFDTVFKDGAGKDCGRRHIRFLSPDLAIDNPDIEDLLGLISRCAANE